jgi:hypothetical protein
MRQRTRTRLFLEQLEDRCVPSVTATVGMAGNLTVTATTTTAVGTGLEIDQTGAHQFTITLNGAPVTGTDQGMTVTNGVYNNVTGNITVNASNNNDKVTVNLMGNPGGTVPNNITLNLAEGNNTAVVENGTMSGSFAYNGGDANDSLTTTNLAVGGAANIFLDNGTNSVTMNSGSVGGSMGITTGEGQDTVVLGDGTNAFTVSGDLVYSGGDDSGDAPNDSLELKNNATLGGNLTTTSVPAVSLDQGSLLVGDLSDTGTPTLNNSLTMAGYIDGNVTLNAGNLDNHLHLTSTGTVGGTLTGLFNGGNDTADIDGTVFQDITLKMGLGNNTVCLDCTMYGNVSVNLGPHNSTGTNALYFGGTIGVTGDSRQLTINGGGGADTVVFESTAVLNGNANVNLGGGNDTFAASDSAVVTGVAVVNGGSGSNTLETDGGSIPAWVHAFNFQTTLFNQTLPNCPI